MFIQSRFAWVARIAMSCLCLFVATSAFATTFPCVQRAIDWNNASGSNWVSFSLVTLHETGAAAYASGRLYNSTCNRLPYAAGTVSCLKTSGWVNALLSDRGFFLPPQGPNQFPTVWQPFDVTKPLLLAVDVIPSDNLAQVHLRQPNATYDFDPRCAGNMLTGDDQWGNRWTVAFQLGKTILN